MVKLTSADQARGLAGKIPVLAILRMIQFEGSDGRYCPETDGYVLVVEPGDDPEKNFPEFGSRGLLTEKEDWPLFDYVEAFEEQCRPIFEAVTHLDDSRTVALIIPEKAIDPRLKRLLLPYLATWPNGKASGAGVTREVRHAD